MRTYPLEFKEQLLGKLLMDGNPSVAQLSEQSGVGKSTLWAWLRQYRRHGSVARGGQLPAPGKGAGASNKDKLAAIIATATMNETERAAWCRDHGLYVGQLDGWRQAFETAELTGGANLRAQLQRERVIGIFPNDDSAHRFIGALLAETNEQWLSRRYLDMDEFKDWRAEQGAGAQSNNVVALGE